MAEDIWEFRKESILVINIQKKKKKKKISSLFKFCKITSVVFIV